MADPTTASLLRRLVLSAIEVREMTGWPAAMTEDYLNILDDIITLASNIDTNTDNVEFTKRRSYFYGRSY